MYVCLCNGYRDSELRDMARRGFTCAEDAYAALGEGPCCGHCVDFAQEILDGERSAAVSAVHVPGGAASDCGQAYRDAANGPAIPPRDPNGSVGDAAA